MSFFANLFSREKVILRIERRMLGGLEGSSNMRTCLKELAGY